MKSVLVIGVGLCGLGGCAMLNRISPEDVEAAGAVAETVAATFGPAGWVGGGLIALVAAGVARMMRNKANRPTTGAPQ